MLVLSFFAEASDGELEETEVGLRMTLGLCDVGDVI